MTAQLHACPRARRVLATVLLLATAALAPQPPARAGEDATALGAERTAVEAWRTDRRNRLTSDTGWLTLSGLFWLKQGDNSFGRASGNALSLDNAALAATAGSFVVSGQQVRFIAQPDSGITHDGQPVTTLDLAADTSGHPTVLESGTLRFYVIERAGNLGVRVRDLNNPHRTGFRGLEYFPVSTDWVVSARFERYPATHTLRIMNILGMEVDMQSPGAVVFTRDGREWR